MRSVPNVYNAEEMNTAKQDVEKLLNKLPDDSTVEDVQYHLYVLDKVRRGLEDAARMAACRKTKWNPASANGSLSSLVAPRSPGHRGNR